MSTTSQADGKGAPLVGVIMGSQSDWKVMRAASEMLDQFDIPHECEVISAHRTPDRTCEYAKTAESRGLQAIIAGAGMAAGLPGMVAAMTVLPVLGVPMESGGLGGLDALMSMVQMPGGIPVGTLAVGKAGAKNAALLTVRMLASTRPDLREQLHQFHEAQTRMVEGIELM